MSQEKKASRDSAPSIRWRLLTLLLLPSIGVLGAGTLSDYFASSVPLTQAYDQALLDSALAIADHIEVGEDGAPVLRLPAEALAILHADRYDSIYFKVTGSNGRVLAGEADLPSLHDRWATAIYGDAHYRGEPIRLVGHTTRTPAGAITITVGETLHKRDRAKAFALSTSLAVDLAELGVILIMILVGVRLALKPLGLVQAEIDRRSPKDLAPLPVEPVPIEVRSGILALNRLFEMVRATGDAQRRFLESAAHQLRTPLTGITAQLELMSQEEPDAARRERLNAVLDGAQRLTHTTQQLLTLARSDEAANLNWEFAPVDLAALVESVITARLTSADLSGIDLGAQIEPASAHGVAWLLHEALSNLANNAIAYTPRGGCVTLHCGMHAGAPFLKVVDDGVGIPAAERDQVMQRFFRASNTRGSGSGLGLAIVREVAQLHAATVSISDGPGGRGTSIELRFPALSGAF
jgi:two-component system sensor histidine kinase TctE